MITGAEARRVARAYLDGLEAECRRTEEMRRTLTDRERDLAGIAPAGDCALVILDDLTIEGGFGWVFFWQSRTYVETGNEGDMLAGNAPLLVAREDGRLHVTGTAEPVEHYIANFRRCGDPHGGDGPR